MLAGILDFEYCPDLASPDRGCRSHCAGHEEPDPEPCDRPGQVTGQPTGDTETQRQHDRTDHTITVASRP